MNKNRPVLTLAYIGDAIYELYIRSYLVKQGLVHVKDLQAESTNWVSAKAQCTFLKKLVEIDFFDEEETSILLRARNHKGSRHPKHTDIITYKHATALEAIFGYLFLEKKYNRMNEIIKRIIGE